MATGCAAPTSAPDAERPAETSSSLLSTDVAVAATVVNVSTASQLEQAVANADADTTIVLADGTYTISDTLYVNASGMTLRSQSGDRSAVVVQGDAGHQALTDAEVLQEILHRYRTLGTGGVGTAMFDAVLGLGIPVLPVTETCLRHARGLLEDAPRISTRDAVHVGVMVEHGISRVLSYDRGFDDVPGIERVEP